MHNYFDTHTHVHLHMPTHTPSKLNIFTFDLDLCLLTCSGTWFKNASSLGSIFSFAHSILLLLAADYFYLSI